MSHELDDFFQKNHLRLTQPRRQIFGALKSSSTPMSIAEIIKTNPSVDKVSVYRIIALFARLHIVTTVTKGWRQSYELASPYAPHHHHLTCTDCGALTEVHSKKLESIILDLAGEYDFAPVGHHFELQGLCTLCRN